MKIEYSLVDDLIPDPRNARTHSDEQIEKLAGLMVEFGWTMPILADTNIRAGHGRQAAARLIYSRGGSIRWPDGNPIPDGMVPWMNCTGWTEAQKRAYMLADNRSAMDADWDMEILISELQGLRDDDFDMAFTAFDDHELDGWFADLGNDGADGGAGSSSKGSLADEFMIPPFSVMNAREGWWQDRKRAWLALGIESEVGRGENLLKMSDTMLKPDPAKRAALQAARGKAKFYNTTDWVKANGLSGNAQDVAGGNGTSVFDPVLCELAYRWFSPVGGAILDPFAGGSVRGIVAARLGRNYTGIDLRPEQIEANRDQWASITQDGDGKIDWIVGDSREMLSHADDEPPIPDSFDMIFSCPPYGDLEVYSDDPADISTLDADAFEAAYEAIIRRAADHLASDRFACFVVGDYRNPKTGLYRNFVSKTIQAFERAGMPLYNEAILVTVIGSLPIRTAKQFRHSRKMGKTHQNILVFVKGDPVKATAACGPVNVDAALERIMVDVADLDLPDADPDMPAAPAGTKPIKISAKMARLEFIQCGPDCIAAGCKGNCCDAPSRPAGCMITINPDEQERIEQLGGVVENGLLQPKPGTKGCPFKSDGLCGLHASGEKPWGCVASPFTLNKSGTLIVRNRYRLLPCFKNDGPKSPAYVAFRSSLEIIFGADETARICDHLAGGGGDLIAYASEAVYARIMQNDAIKAANGIANRD